MANRPVKALVVAHFKGEKISLNYIPGYEYTLQFTENRENKNPISIVDKTQVPENSKTRRKNGKPVEYKTLLSFLKNWTVRAVTIID